MPDVPAWRAEVALHSLRAAARQQKDAAEAEAVSLRAQLAAAQQQGQEALQQERERAAEELGQMRESLEAGSEEAVQVCVTSSASTRSVEGSLPAVSACMPLPAHRLGSRRVLCIHYDATQCIV